MSQITKIIFYSLPTPPDPREAIRRLIRALKPTSLCLISRTLEEDREWENSKLDDPPLGTDFEILPDVATPEDVVDYYVDKLCLRAETRGTWILDEIRAA